MPNGGGTPVAGAAKTDRFGPCGIVPVGAYEGVRWRWRLGLATKRVPFAQGRKGGVEAYEDTPKASRGPRAASGRVWGQGGRRRPGDERTIPKAA